MPARNRESAAADERPRGAHPDGRLLRAFVEGDAAAVRRVERWAWEIAHFRWGSIPPSDRGDLIQDTVTDVWRAASSPGFELRESLRALTRRVASARCIDWMRKRRPTVSLSETHVDPFPNPYEMLLRRDERARVRWAVQEMDQRCRDIIREHFFEELPYAVIAERRGKSEATMRVQMFHCMKHLRELWARWAK